MKRARAALRAFSAWLASAAPRSTSATIQLGPVQLVIVHPEPAASREPSELARRGARS